jgi:hypothetical protein
MVKIREILESFNTRPPVEWRRDGSATWGLFTLGEEPYAVYIEELDPSKFELSASLRELLDSSGVVTVIFGNLTEQGTISTMARGKGTNGIKVMSAVMHALDEYVAGRSTGVVIFSAKKRDGFYESRASLYNTMCTTFAKRMGFSFVKFADADGTYFITLRHGLELSDADVSYIKKNIIGSLSFSDKLKRLPGK